MEGVSRPAVMARIKEEMQRAAEKPMVLELELPSVEEAARTAAVVAEAEAVKKAAEKAAEEKAATEKAAAEKAAVDKEAAEKAAEEEAAAKQAPEKTAVEKVEKAAAEKVEKRSSLFGGLVAVIASPFESKKEVPVEAAAPAEAPAALTSNYASPTKSPTSPDSPTSKYASPTSPDSSSRRTVTFGPGRLGLTFGEVDGCVTIHKVAPGSPGEVQGIIVGSKVVSVAGKPTEGVPHAEVVARIKEEMQRTAEKPMVLELESEAYAETATATEEVNSIAPATAEQAAMPADADLLASMVQGQERDDDADLAAAVRAAANHVAALKTEKRVSLFGGLTAAANAAATAITAPFESKKDAAPAPSPAPATAPAGPSAEKLAEAPAEPFANLDDLEEKAAKEKAAKEKAAKEKAAAEKEAAEKAAAEKAAAEKVENRSSLFGGLVAAIASPFESTKQEAVETAAPAEAPAAMTRLRLTVTFGPGPLGMTFGQVDGYVTILNVSPGSQAEHQGVVVGSRVVSVAGEPMEGVSRPAVMARIKEEMQRAAEKPMVLELELPSVEEAARTAAVVAEAEAVKKTAEENAAASTASSIPSRSSLRSRARNLPVHESRNLNELCFGSLEGLQGGRLRDFFPEEYELREADRLNYRYPGVGGQSYYDLIVQIRAVLLTIEASRRDAVVVCDLAVARVLLGYFQGHPIAGIPDLDVPPGVVELSRTHAGFSRTDFPVHVGLASMLANLR
jgi:broad specificity phosphatase PhoE